MPLAPSFLGGDFLRQGFRQGYIEFADKLQINLNLLHSLSTGFVWRVDEYLVNKLVDHRRGQNRKIRVLFRKLQKLLRPAGVLLKHFNIVFAALNELLQLSLLTLIVRRKQLVALLR